MLRLLQRYHYPSKLLAASLKSAEQIKECAELGAHAVTINEKVFQSLIEEHALTHEQSPVLRAIGKVRLKENRFRYSPAPRALKTPGRGELKVIFLPVKGCWNSSEQACRQSRFSGFSTAP